MPQPKKTLTLNAEQMDRLNELAVSLNCSQEDLVTQAIDQFLEVQAWQLDTALIGSAAQPIIR